MESDYPQLFCPLCGTTKSIRYFDPSGFSVDVIGVRFRGLGRGKGFSIVSEGSLLEGEDPVVGRIADRVAVLYDMLFEGDSVVELLDEVNESLGADYDSLFEAVKMELLPRYQDYVEEDEDEDGFEEVLVAEEVPLTMLDDEILRGEHEYEEVE